jgi:hypothetical protein
MEARAAGQGERMRDQPQDEDKSVETVPLDLDEGEDVVIRQENVGEDNMRGGGEWPDPDTPPSDAAPGSLADD